MFLKIYRPEAALVFHPSVVEEGSLDPTFSKGVCLFREGRYLEVIDLLNPHIENGSGYISASRSLVSCCYALVGDYSSALAICEDDDEGEALQNAMIHYLSGDLETAKIRFAEAFAKEDLLEAELLCRLLFHDTLINTPQKLNEDFSKEYLQWAEVIYYANQKLPQEVSFQILEFFQKALQSNRLSGDDMQQKDYCHLFIAEAYLHLGDIKQCAFHLAQIDSSKDSDMRDSTFSRIRAAACLAAHDPKAPSLFVAGDRLSALLQKVLGQKPYLNECTSFLDQAALLALQDNLSESIACYNMLLQENVDPDVYMERGIVHLLQGNRSAALADLALAEKMQLTQYFGWTRPSHLPTASFLIEWVNSASDDESDV